MTSYRYGSKGWSMLRWLGCVQAKKGIDRRYPYCTLGYDSTGCNDRAPDMR